MLKQRVITALVLAPPLVAAILWLPADAMAVLTGAVFLLAGEEWLRLSGWRRWWTRVGGVLVLGALLLALWLCPHALVLPLATAVGCLWWLAAMAWLSQPARLAAPTPRNALLKAVAGVFVLVPAWAATLWLHGHARFGLWLLAALLLVWAADSGAYFAGSRWGRRKLAPRISPGKTWAGVGGGIALALLVALAAGAALGLGARGLAILLPLTVVAVALSIVGDLTESIMKRHALVKDSGSLFPGHGGLLDRLDSISAFLPVFALGLHLSGLP